MTCGVAYLYIKQRKSKPVTFINTEHNKLHARTTPIGNRPVQELEKIRDNAKTAREALQEAEYHLQHEDVIQVVFHL